MSAKNLVALILLLTTPAFYGSPVNADNGAVASSINSFGLKLFQEINKTEKNSNVMISPLSVSMALTMVYNGAEGETRQAMSRTLKTEGISIEELNESYKNLSNSLTSLDSAVVFQIANSIWYRQGFQVENKFLDMNSAFFNARISASNFGDPNTVDTINAWVDENTNGKIPRIVEKPLSANLVMLLINAIYFHGNWSTKFDTESTIDDNFTLTAGSKIACKMMNQEKWFPYFENDIVQAIELPYGNGAFSMVIILPKPGMEVNDLIGRIDDEKLKLWSSSLRERTVKLSMPRFKLEYDKDLSDILRSMGMDVAFTDLADFSGINKDKQLLISFVKHKTYIDVNEEGTEAAAVTVVGVEVTSAPPESVVMRVDRPFLYLIRETGSGTIIFMGKTADPKFD